MPVWAWIVVGVVAAAVIAAIVVVAFTAWNRAVRRYITVLVAKREEARSVRRAFEEIVRGLRLGSHQRQAAFAGDPNAVERHSLADMASRARVLAEELNTMALPARLVPAAEALADAADILAEEVSRAGEGSIGDESLEAILSTDLDRVVRAFAHADSMLAPLAEEYGANEQDVYGRGLYI